MKLETLYFFSSSTQTVFQFEASYIINFLKRNLQRKNKKGKNGLDIFSLNIMVAEIDRK